MASKHISAYVPREFRFTMDDGTVVERATIAGAGNGSAHGMDIAILPHDAAGIMWLNVSDIESVTLVKPTTAQQASSIYERIDDPAIGGSVHEDIRDMDMDEMTEYFGDTDPAEWL
jgi:hypothetical protein